MNSLRDFLRDNPDVKVRQFHAALNVEQQPLENGHIRLVITEKNDFGENPPVMTGAELLESRNAVEDVK